jgi:putative sterol carrier protein
MSEARTVREVFDGMPATFIGEKAAGMNAVVQFEITGEGGGKWYAAIENGELRVVEGEREDASLTLTAAAADYLAISTGRLNGQLAFMTGRLRAKGDLALAMKMQLIFKQPAPRPAQ